MIKLKKYLSFFLLFASINFAGDYRYDIINLYLDCRGCDLDYLKSNLGFINFVHDREDADVIQIFTFEQTGSGATEVTIISFGNNYFTGLIDTTHYYYLQTESYESKRESMLQGIKNGLLPFLMQTSHKEHIEYKVNGKSDKKTIIEDPWNYWVFRTDLRGYFAGEETTSDLYLSSSLSASRVTESLKLRFIVFGNYSENNFKFVDSTSEYTLKNIYKDYKFKTLAIKSLDNHWSAGGWIFLSSSTYKNLNLSYGFAPGIEYNIFPYSDYNSRQFRIEYKIWLRKNQYYDETIYFKESETLAQQELSVAFGLIKQWGRFGVYLKGSNYFHDFNYNSLQLSTDITFNIVKGLGIDIDFRVTRIHDQITLARKDATIDEILLRQRELQTDFGYRASIGFSYYFGSIYNYTINPRFGD